MKLTKKTSHLWRSILASIFGGFYSLIIFIDELPSVVITLSKIVSAMIILLIAFRFYRLKSFLASLGVFVFSSFIILGVVVAIYFFTNSNIIAINNSIFYFDISSRLLLVSAFFAYILSCVIVRLYNNHLSKNEIYSLEIINNGNSVNLFAFADTGNKLREPFSNLPVIIVDKNMAKCIVDESKIRLIPTSTVSGETLLTAFKPDKIIIKSSTGKEVVENAYIALSSDIKSKSFSAILNPEILSV